MRSTCRPKVLVTQGAMKHSLAIIQHLSKQGYDVSATIMPQQRRTLAQLSRHTAATYPLVEDQEDACIEQLLSLLQAHSFDVLVPVGYPITEFVSRHAATISACVGLMCPAGATCELAGDKLAMAQFAESLDIAAPRTYQVKDPTELPSLAEQLAFPVVVKGRHESGKGIVSVAHTPDDLVSRYGELCRRFQLTTAERYPILQEYIPGWGCGFFALYQKGVLKRMFMHRRIREYPVSGGASSCAESFFDEELAVLGMRMLDQLSWHGVAMVECRFDTSRKRYCFIELNAKFWGSLELALVAGADFVGDYVRGALDEPLGYSRDFRHVRFQWAWDGDWLHALHNPKAIGSVAKDFLNPWVVKDFRWNDPVPSFAKLYRSVQGLASGIRAKCSTGRPWLLH